MHDILIVIKQILVEIKEKKFNTTAIHNKFECAYKISVEGCHPEERKRNEESLRQKLKNEYNRYISAGGTKSEASIKKEVDDGIMD